MGQKYLDMYRKLTILKGALSKIDLCYQENCIKCLFYTKERYDCQLEIVKKKTSRILNKLEKII